MENEYIFEICKKVPQPYGAKNEAVRWIIFGTLALVWALLVLVMQDPFYILIGGLEAAILSLLLDRVLQGFLFSRYRWKEGTAQMHMRVTDTGFGMYVCQEYPDHSAASLDCFVPFEAISSMSYHPESNALWIYGRTPKKGFPQTMVTRKGRRLSSVSTDDICVLFQNDESQRLKEILQFPIMITKGGTA